MVRYLPSPGSLSPVAAPRSIWSQRSFFWVSHMGAGTHTLRLPSTAFPGALALS